MSQYLWPLLIPLSTFSFLTVTSFTTPAATPEATTTVPTKCFHDSLSPAVHMQLVLLKWYSSNTNLCFNIPSRCNSWSHCWSHCWSRTQCDSRGGMCWNSNKNLEVQTNCCVCTLSQSLFFNSTLPLPHRLRKKRMLSVPDSADIKLCSTSCNGSEVTPSNNQGVEMKVVASTEFDDVRLRDCYYVLSSLGIRIFFCMHRQIAENLFLFQSLESMWHGCMKAETKDLSWSIMYVACTVLCLCIYIT